MQNIRVRRGTAAAWTSADPILRLNELGVESDTGLSKTGDGVTPYSTLAYDASLPGPGVNPGDGIPAWRALAVTAPVTGGTPGAGTVGTTQLADGGVTPAKQSMAAPAPRYKTGAYYFPQAGRTTNANGASTMTAVPFWVGKTQAFDRIGCAVTTLDAAASIRLGIYADTGEGLPGALVVDAGTVSGAAVAAVEATISQTLAPGWYWLAAVNQGGNPTTRCISIVAPLAIGASTVAEATQSQPVTGVNMTGVTGALPGTFTLTGRSLAPALVVLRAA